MNRQEYQAVALARLADAEGLLSLGRWDGAYYLAGYVVEAAFKACIARQFALEDIPHWRTVQKIYTHDLETLAGVANLEQLLAAQRLADRQFDAYWLTVRGWTEESRYTMRQSQRDATDMVTAVADPQHGVLQWLRQHW
jgi:HEPN domain-containing protein